MLESHAMLFVIGGSLSRIPFKFVCHNSNGYQYTLQ